MGQPVGDVERPSIGERRRRRLAAARLYLIIEAKPRGRPAEDVVEPALAGGVDMVQLREKVTDDDAIVAAARSFRALCDEHGALLILNDRPELVLDCAADGVHLGQEDASVDEARAVLGGDALVGVSTHSAAQIAAARDSSADYIAVGPVHATPTKPGVAAVGEELVRHAAEHAARPFFAIGGIDAANAPAVAAAGATRIAVVRAIRDAEDPHAAAETLRAALPTEARAGTAR
jgi:thiamine-phosphate pyrophosphorylase